MGLPLPSNFLVYRRALSPCVRGEDASTWKKVPILPVVWSTSGPVPPDGVPPIRLVQSKSSLLSCTNPHTPSSKVQSSFPGRTTCFCSCGRRVVFPLHLYN